MLNVLSGGYSRHPSLLLLFTGAVEVEKPMWFSRRAALKHSSGGEGKMNGGESRVGASGWRLISLPH